ncbi:thiamine pyrophosphate-dependent enzyme [Chloroflexota bacterium]
MARDLEQYLRPGTGVTTFCPGCGEAILMGLILRAIDGLQLKMDDMLFVSGIGCAGWIPSPYFNADILHTLHGRTIAFATGAKMANPKLKVMVISGDGDLADIGGNHLIHGARRNIDLIVICANNMNYGMTGGQVCATTPLGAVTMTTHEGNPYRPFDLCRLVKAAGAAYVSRYPVTQPVALINGIKKALKTEGFAFIEALTPCPVQFGSRNRFSSPADMLKDLIDRCITREKAKKLSPEELRNKIITGEFSGGED